MQPLEASIYEWVDTLANKIGPRMCGTKANRDAYKYVAAEMTRLGLQVEEQPFPCTAWSCQKSLLEMEGRSLAVHVNPFSQPCDVTRVPVPVATIAELETADIGGKIVLMYGELTRQVIACKTWFLKEERDIRIIGLLEEKQPAAILTVQPNPGSINRIIEDQEFHIPSATIQMDTALELFTHPHTPVHLLLETTTGVGETANVVGRLPGKSADTIVLMGHFDSKIDTPAATDNATGVAALLALAQTFADQQLETTLEFISFANEEYWPIGDDEYLRLAGEDHMKDVRLGINFDGHGFILDGNTLAIYSSSPEFTQLVDGIKTGFPAMQWTDPWPESNHSTFSWRGVPCLAYGSTVGRPINHQLDDSIRWVSPRRVAEAVECTARVIRAIQDWPNDRLRKQE
jgi:aminopeptidase YwaD